MKKISFAVLNYNGRKLLKKYFDSVFSQTLLPDEIIMVDNASSDNSVDFVRINYPTVKVIINKENYGTARGSNTGFEKTTGDYIVFQSNDIVLEKNCIKSLVEFLNKNKKAGICTSVLLKKNTKLIDNAGGIIDVFGYPMQKYPNIDISLIPESGEVFFSYGGSFVIRRELYDAIGGFDNRYFTLNDDVDLCWRVRLAGYSVAYTKKSIVHHKGSATLGRIYDRTQKHYLSERNLMRTFIKDADLRNIFIYFPAYLLLLVAEMIYMVYRLKFELFFADFKAILWNIIYLAETLKLRKNIQKNKIIKIGDNLFEKTSFKLKLFRDFKKAL